jgi:hypothetical protein
MEHIMHNNEQSKTHGKTSHEYYRNNKSTPYIEHYWNNKNKPWKYVKEINNKWNKIKM